MWEGGVSVQALNLIDHLIRNGSPRMIDDARDNIEKLRALQDFSFKEQQYDRGNGGGCGEACRA